jgi:hypothetical protein
LGVAKDEYAAEAGRYEAFLEELYDSDSTDGAGDRDTSASAAATGSSRKRKRKRTARSEINIGKKQSTQRLKTLRHKRDTARKAVEQANALLSSLGKSAQTLKGDNDAAVLSAPNVRLHSIVQMGFLGMRTKIARMAAQHVQNDAVQPPVQQQLKVFFTSATAYQKHGGRMKNDAMPAGSLEWLTLRFRP